MSRLRSQRSSIRRNFTRIYNELRDEKDKADESNVEVIRNLQKRLWDRYQQLIKLDDEVMMELHNQDISQAEMDEEYDTVQEYRDKWKEMEPEHETTQADEVSVIQSVISSTSAGKSRYKLPKLKLVEFNGNPREWLSFWSQFKGIHEDDNITLEEKFQYLIQATTIGSVARQVVSSFPPTAENYGKAIAHLKARFGKENVLVEVYVRDLLKLVLTNANGQQPLPLSTLYDKLETQLRALESLGVTSDKYASMLYPLVESSLSDDILIAWERIRNQQTANTTNENQLKRLMEFLQGEVESGIRLQMAKRGMTSDDEDWSCSAEKRKKIFHTTSDLLSVDKQQKGCLFCKKFHRTQVCDNIQKLTLKERYARVREAEKCFKCLVGNHFARNCKATIKCVICGGGHYKIVCNKDERKPIREINAFSAYDEFEESILQTILVNVHGSYKTQAVRSLIDGGSSRSYISSAAAKNFGLQIADNITLAHSLFGGHVTKMQKHSVYEVKISNVENTIYERYRLVEVEKICGSISSTPRGEWLKELTMNGIQLSDDIEKEYPIHMLLGANVANIYTGKIFKTEKGPVAFETCFGWTVTGCISEETKGTHENQVLTVHSMYVSTASIQDLWNLDIIGIHDPVQEKSKEELANSALSHFNDTVTRLADGRYEVSLPWIEGHQPVSKNKEIAERRLQSSISKLKERGKLEDYQKVFDEWQQLGIIEEVDENESDNDEVSYLPHHPVFNDKSITTPIRPVFDASAKSKGFPSLNQCLEKGKNMLNEMPALLILFRLKPFAFTSDIKKAFLQISVIEKDRNYLRFLWLKDGRMIVFRHCRVVFGISSSPFLLAATLEYHLNEVKGDDVETAQLLKRSIYVDNCLGSVATEEERDEFIKRSTNICADAKFELRGWVQNKGEVLTGDVPGVGSPECGLGTGSKISQETLTSVLGLLWDTSDDTLSLDMRKILHIEEAAITKRTILAATHHIFDPIGFSTPSIIIPKMLLQELCKIKKIKWDNPVPDEIRRKFLSWKNSLHNLTSLKVPRWMNSSSEETNSLHIFTDASKKAYAAVAFLRCEINGEVRVQLVLAKARVTTIKPITTPRLELVACECGAKMANYLQGIFSTNTKLYLWSDSDNALSWIKRKENWQVFVFNRVKTIKQFTEANDWRHIPGHLNPADLPSRGCSNKQLLESKWWEGPEWLKQDEEFWPKSAINCDEKVVMSERKRVVGSHLVQEMESSRYFRKFSNLRKVIRMIAWMKRWITYKRNNKARGDLSLQEEEEAEKCMWRLVQKDTFINSDKVLSQLNAKKDDSGIWRVETKLLLRNDTESFRRPILLPKDHPAVEQLVRKEHLDMKHCGAQTLRSAIRERFWIINSRVIARRVIHECKRCTRYTTNKMTAPAPALPKNRVREAVPFEVTGVDLGGPLILHNGEKAWFVVFTCAVYRAVHLELITSLSTASFMQALRRFIARRGRPAVIYTDNGTNFVGTENLMAKLDWEEIMSQTDAKRIRWIFNPPSAPWWGGWWERIVGIVKQLLRRRLGKDLLDYEEMATVLCDCEQLINSRPLTYLSEDPNELIAITPMMFLNESRGCEVADLDTIESNSFGEKFKQRQEIREQLRLRFRKEYLSHLVHRNVRHSEYKTIKVGDVVIVEEENKKRIHWPIARVIQTFPGQDGIIRSVKIKIIRNGKIVEMDRPIQRLYMLESSATEGKELVEGNNRETKIKSDQKGNEPLEPSEGNEPASASEGNEPSSTSHGNEPSSTEHNHETTPTSCGSEPPLTPYGNEPSSSKNGNKTSSTVSKENGPLSASKGIESIQYDKNVVDNVTKEVKITRSGRRVCKPNRFEG